MTPEDNVGKAPCLPNGAACIDSSAEDEGGNTVENNCCSGECGHNRKWNGTNYITLSPVCWKGWKSWEEYKQSVLTSWSKAGI